MSNSRLNDTLQAQSNSASNPNTPRTQNACYRMTYQALGILDTYVLRNLLPANTARPFEEGDIGGDAYWGQLWQLFREDGRGLDQIIEYAETCAKKTKRGLAWWRFGPKKTVVLLTQPADIEELLKANLKNILLHDSTGQFKEFFGPESIFSSPYRSKNWLRLRPRFLHTLFLESTLKKDIQPMQQIISQHFAQIQESKEGLVDNMEEFANSITMDMIGKLKLGLEKIPENSKKKVSTVIAQAAIEVANPWEKLLSDYVPFYKSVYRYFYPSKLDLLLKSGYQILREEYIAPNRDAILTTENWLNPEKSDSQINLNDQATIYEITQFLVAGHETTAKLVLLLFLILGDKKHSAILEKLRAEIDGHPLNPKEWDREDLANLPYLDAIVNETLRLYPPIPDILFEVTHPFFIADGKVNKGDTLIISPRITQRSEAVWGENATEFHPERFLEKKYSEHQFFPFGFTPRQCVGQRFSIQEAKLIIARAVLEFDFSHDLHHPFPFHQVFTMRLDLQNIQMHFTERLRPKPELNNIALSRIGPSSFTNT